MLYKKIVAMFLAVTLVTVFSGFTGADLSQAQTSSSAEQDSSTDSGNLINKVEVFIPNPTYPEAVAGLSGKIALDYYMVARAYLDKFLMYDISEIDIDEYQKLLSDTITMFENAELLSQGFADAADAWIESEESRTMPTYTVISEADERTASLNPFVLTAYAAGQSESEKWAQDIVDTFDKAQSGSKVKTLAEHLGTDSQHAYQQLKMAQDILEGATYADIADKADTAVKTAQVLKTAGTVAGFVIAAAPVATGSIATMAAGEAAVTIGGVITSGVNSVCEVTSTGAELYYGTEDNLVTQTAENMKNDSVWKIVDTTVGVAGAGYNLFNQFKDTSKFMDQPHTDALDKLWTNLTANDGKEASNLFGILSFGLNKLASSEEDSGQTLTAFSSPVWDENGMHIIIEDTAIGTDPDQQEAMKTVLTDAGISEEIAQALVDNAVNNINSGIVPEIDAIPDYIGTEELIDRIIQENADIAPGREDFNVNEYLDDLYETLYEIAAVEYRETAVSETETPEPTAVPETETPQPTAAGELNLEALAGDYAVAMEGYEDYIVYGIAVTGPNTISAHNLYSDVYTSLTVDQTGLLAKSETEYDDYGLNPSYITMEFSAGDDGRIYLRRLAYMNDTVWDEILLFKK